MRKTTLIYWVFNFLIIFVLFCPFLSPPLKAHFWAILPLFCPENTLKNDPPNGTFWPFFPLFSIVKFEKNWTGTGRIPPVFHYFAQKSPFFRGVPPPGGLWSLKNDKIDHFDWIFLWKFIDKLWWFFTLFFQFFDNCHLLILYFFLRLTQLF